ncbi:MAG: hypothetical protein ACE15E_16275 [Acidobacteriota bacterium]
MYSMFHPFRCGIARYTEDLLLALEKRELPVKRVNARFWEVHRPDICGSVPGRAGRMLQLLYNKLAYRLYRNPPESQGSIRHYQISGNPETIYLLKDFRHTGGPRVVTVHDAEKSGAPV